MSHRYTETELYPAIAAWMRRHLRCFETEINVGLRYSRADVLGIKDIGGELCGDIETTIVEVKRGNEPFATASGQALGYSVYANRVYLADQREKVFSQAELEIASNLGIGLVQVRSGRCKEVLSSPYHKPISRMSLELLEKVALRPCQICSTFFKTGTRKNPYSSLARSLRKAINEEKTRTGLMFWNYGLADRKKMGFLKIKRYQTTKYETHERRFICPDCIDHLFKPLLHDS